MVYSLSSTDCATSHSIGNSRRKVALKQDKGQWAHKLIALSQNLSFTDMSSQACFLLHICSINLRIFILPPSLLGTTDISPPVKYLGQKQHSEEVIWNIISMLQATTSVGSYPTKNFSLPTNCDVRNQLVFPSSVVYLAKRSSSIPYQSHSHTSITKSLHISYQRFPPKLGRKQ